MVRSKMPVLHIAVLGLLTIFSPTKPCCCCNSKSDNSKYAIVPMLAHDYANSHNTDTELDMSIDFTGANPTIQIYNIQDKTTLLTLENVKKDQAPYALISNTAKTKLIILWIDLTSTIQDPNCWAQVLDRKSKKCLFTLHNVYAASFNAEGDIIETISSHGNVKNAWDAQTGKKMKHYFDKMPTNPSRPWFYLL